MKWVRFGVRPTSCHRQWVPKNSGGMVDKYIIEEVRKGHFNLFYWEPWMHYDRAIVISGSFRELSAMVESRLRQQIEGLQEILDA